jgi:hypothetical protein
MITECIQLGNLYIKVLNHSDKDRTFEPKGVQDACKKVHTVVLKVKGKVVPVLN